jgi:hypothetical protein
MISLNQKLSLFKSDTDIQEYSNTYLTCPICDAPKASGILCIYHRQQWLRSYKYYSYLAFIIHTIKELGEGYICAQCKASYLPDNDYLCGACAHALDK